MKKEKSPPAHFKADGDRNNKGAVLHPEDMSFRWISILILFMSVAIKLWLSCFNKKLGKRINSKVMLATSADALGDVVTTSATICSIGIYGALGFNVCHPSVRFLPSADCGG